MERYVYRKDERGDSKGFGKISHLNSLLDFKEPFLGIPWQWFSHCWRTPHGTRPK